MDTGVRQFGFYDTRVVVRSELPEVLAVLDALFRHFALPTPPGDAPLEAAPVTCRLLRINGSQAAIMIDGRTVRVEREGDAPGLAYLLIVRAAFTRIRSHLLIHAGVVSRSQHAVVIAGNSGSGKSTLVLELVRRGFRVLSDEIAAVRLGDGVIEPFPRSLGLRAGATMEYANAPAALPLIGGGHKLLLDPTTLGVDRMGVACRAALLVLLEGGPQAPSTGDCLHVVLTALPDELRGVLRDLFGVASVEAVPNRLFPELRIRHRAAADTLSVADAACARFGVAILETSRGSAPTVHTTAPPALMPLDKASAARALVAHLHVSRHSALVQSSLGGRGSQLLWQLGRLVEPMHCFTLAGGRPTERADRICAALAEASRS